MEWLASVDKSRDIWGFHYVVTQYESPRKDNNYQTSIRVTELPNYPITERGKWKMLPDQEVLAHWDLLKRIVGTGIDTEPKFDVVRWYNSIMRQS